jgi:hypothetical protein
MAKKWIAGAIERPGALTRKAKAVHMSLAAFEANPPKGISTRTKREINLAKTMRGFHHPHMGHK